MKTDMSQRRRPARPADARRACRPCSRAALVAAAMVRVYQWTLSPLKQLFFGTSCSCRFQPTCSCYARAALLRFGFWRGSWYTLRRLLRCHPWHPGGYDPVPDLNRCDQADMSTALKHF